MTSAVLQRPDDEMFQAILQRDASRDGTFVFAVTTTGVFCRPSCPARRPARENIAIFPTSGAAQNAGFRPCKRCNPNGQRTSAELVTRAAALAAVPASSRFTPSRLAARLEVNPQRLQRAFRTELGVSIRSYLEMIEHDRANVALRAGKPVRRAAADAGITQSRLYTRAAKGDGLTPGARRRKGAGVTIHATTVPCSLGHLLVAGTDRGLVSVRLGDDPVRLTQELATEFPAATIERTGVPTKTVSDLLARVEGRPPRGDLPLDLQATAFQRRVWEAISRIPRGKTVTYSELASNLGSPSAARAVARACASNPVALAIPCHRVVGRDGRLAGYRWGIDRKRILLSREAKETP